MTDLNALIIDDEIDTCVLLTAILKQIGVKTSFAGTLMDGQNRLKERNFQILFLDNNLPDGSGLEQLLHIKDKFPDLKVFMISAYDGDKEHEIAKVNGAADFISKPLSGAAIRSSLRKHFTTLKI